MIFTRIGERQWVSPGLQSAVGFLQDWLLRMDFTKISEHVWISPELIAELQRCVKTAPSRRRLLWILSQQHWLGGCRHFVVKHHVLHLESCDFIPTPYLARLHAPKSTSNKKL